MTNPNRKRSLCYDVRISKRKITSKGKRKFADYILFYKPNVPIAIIEAKDNKHSVKSGIQQVLDYADILDIPLCLQQQRRRFLFSR